MKKTFNNILFDKYGQSIPLSQDDFIEYLLQNLYQLRSENDRLKKKLEDIEFILNSEPSANDF